MAVPCGPLPAVRVEVQVPIACCLPFAFRTWVTDESVSLRCVIQVSVVPGDYQKASVSVPLTIWSTKSVLCEKHKEVDFSCSCVPCTQVPVPVRSGRGAEGGLGDPSTWAGQLACSCPVLTWSREKPWCGS